MGGKNRYVQGDDIYGDIKLVDISKAKKYKQSELPDELGEEPYPSELNKHKTGYFNMAGTKTYNVETYLPLKEEREEPDYIVKFYKRNPEYLPLEKAIGQDYDYTSGAPVSKKRKGDDLYLGMDEAWMLIKKKYVTKSVNADEDNPAVSYYVNVTDLGKRAFGLMRRELFDLGHGE